jgi:GntR family transcriptional regulator
VNRSAASGSAILDIEVNKHSPVPIYVQISDAIRALIASGDLPPDSVLPPSGILCERFGTTRMTLRQAYAVLEREGLLDPQRGRGTFVRRPRIARTLSDMIGFSEEMLAQGKRPSSRLLNFELGEPSEAARAFLAEDRVYRIERLRLADGVPIAIEEAQILASICPGLEHFDFNRESLYQVLEQEYGLRLARTEQLVSAAIPGRRDRDLLEIGPGIALLNIARKSYLASGRPGSYGITRYRGDRYTAAVHAERRPAGPR